MTEKLKTLLDERASAPDFAVPDVAALRAAGRRRRRLTRSAATVGGLAAASTAAALVLVAVHAATDGTTDGDARPDVANGSPSPYAARAPYALGSVIHLDDDTVDIGHPVVSFVRTRAGFVTVDDRRRVWSVARDEVVPMGRTEESTRSVVSDPRSGLAAWLDTSQPTPRFAVLDQASGNGPTYVDAAGPATEVYAVDQGTLFVREGRRAVAVDLDTGARTVVMADVGEPDAVIDARVGAVAFEVTDDSSESADRVSVGPTRDRAGTPFAIQGDEGTLSPDGTYLAFDADELTVYDTRDGRRLELGLPGFATVYEWTSPTTAAVVSAADESAPVQLQTCDVVALTCEVTVADLGTFDEIGDVLALPGGIDVG